MTNRALDSVAELLGPAVTTEALIAALYVIRAPRNLTAIIPMAREFRDWREANPELEQLPRLPADGPTYTERLDILDQIADLDTGDEQLTGRILEKREDVGTPLRPYTGDSVIGELLCIRAKAGADAEAFTRVARWLVWQAQRFTLRYTSQDSYSQYLLTEDFRLKDQKPSSRLYSAYLALRPSAVRDKQHGGIDLNALCHLGLDLNVDRSIELALLARYGHLSSRSTEVNRLRRYAMKELGYGFEHLVQTASQVAEIMPRPVALLLATIWGEQLRVRIGAGKGGGGGRPQGLANRTLIKRGLRLTEMLTRTEVDDIHSGVLLEFLPRDDDAACDDEDKDPVDDDPEEEMQREPAFSLFLADNEDMIGGYYAAKGVQNAIEYQNAQLHWSKAVLSETALAAVVALVGLPEFADTDKYHSRARLAIGLSLLTGRALEDVAAVRIENVQPEVDKKHPLAIDMANNCLLLWPARPNLRVAPAPLAVCYTKDDQLALVLPLPSKWRGLIQSAHSLKSRQPKKVARSARRKLADLDSSLHVTEKGVRYAFIRALAECTAGDLGVQKVITDGHQANTQNIIHYASYRVDHVQRYWRQAAERLFGSLPAAFDAVQSDDWVGAQHAFNVDALTGYFQEISARLKKAEQAGEWPRAFNLLTLYLSYWLGLGLAGRKTRTPVPRIILAGRWALVTDKHRADGSTDRLVPMTDHLREQIWTYVALARELAISMPALDPIVVNEGRCEIRLQYIHMSKGVVPYQPKYQERDEQLTPLPANWGRKLVRSYSTQLSGRFRDAELGHWTRGRHAWHQTSTFDATAFQQQWLKLQEDLEQRLGFTVITVAGCSAHDVQLPLQLPRKQPSKKAADSPSKQNSEELPIKALMQAAAADHYRQVEADGKDSEPSVVMEMVRRTIGEQRHQGIKHQERLAEAACLFVRKRYGTPLFLTRPRPLFSNKFVLHSAGLQTLAYLQAHVLDAFCRDLAYLPERGRPDENKITADIERGRLVMIAIWRLGMTRWAVIEAWLRHLYKGAAILAQGDNRYMSFRVVSESTREPMRRTVFMDCFTSTYATVERETISTVLAPLFGRQPELGSRKRRARIETALRAYLNNINAPISRNPLAMMTDAAGQWLMSTSAPVIAAYARGAIFTEDLDDGQLRRLAGLTPQREYNSVQMEALPASKPNELHASGSDLPADLLDGSELVKALTKHAGKSKGKWRYLIKKYRPKTETEKLLQQFTLWLLKRTQERGDQAYFGAHEQKYFISRVRIVSYAWLGYTRASAEQMTIDGDLLAVLGEFSSEQFPERLQHGAWFQFYHFLKDAKADDAGFEIGDLGPPPERAVSAKMLRASELDRLLATLPSARSGIGNAALRMSARHHIELMCTYGLRRSESAHLRSVDLQGDLCRVQAYEEFGLKTAWADRVLPVGFALPDTQTWMQQASNENRSQLIDPDEYSRANPDNFFDAVNRLIKVVTQDRDMGSHHLRHTLISRLALTLLFQPARLDKLDANLPWVKPLIIDEERMNVLLGAEGDAGQGMRAVAALVGHSHPTTTIRHYVHVLCVALYGALHKNDTLDISRSFERRIASRATIQRWAKAAREAVPDQTKIDVRRCQINKAMRARIERKCGDAGISRDETPLSEPDDNATTLTTGDSDPVTATPDFDHLELIDRSLRDGYKLVAAEILERAQTGLEYIAAISTGQRGSGVKRHPLEEQDQEVWLPKSLPSGTATQAAATLCDWLALLRVQFPADYYWLLDKWLYASERERGRMRLDDDDEINRAQHLPGMDHVVVEVENARVAKNRGKRKPMGAPRMRLKCLNSKGGKIIRDTVAVRWVMTYVAALYRARANGNAKCS